MNKVIEFGHIAQFSDIVQQVHSHHDCVGTDADGKPMCDHAQVGTPYPIIRFVGTPKLHGTHGAVGIMNGEVFCQSRNTILSAGEDSAGLYKHMREAVSTQAMETLMLPRKHHNMLWYGEWCGKGIQKGGVLQQLSPRFFIFELRIINGQHRRVRNTGALFSGSERKLLNENNIFFIDQFVHWVVDIDFNHPEKAQRAMDKIGVAVERQCPVGKFFGAIGAGEGVVWTSTSGQQAMQYKFKTKGQHHAE